jgi:prepilin-type N-terminal cleavage/methylation domain-containing protein
VCGRSPSDNGERTTDNAIVIRIAGANEVGTVLDLLRRNRLPDAGLAEHAANLLVAVESGRLVGSAALEVYGDAALLRSVAVDQALRGRGLGVALTQAALDLARERGVRAVYLLTETAAEFFGRLGFRRMSRAGAEPAVGASVEFTTACPASATCMALSLEPAPAAKPTAGYSIIELVIAIVVFGILLSIAYMRMTPAVNHARVNRAATIIATDLQYAQMLAVRQRVPVAVIVDNGLKSYIIRLRDTSVTFRDRFFGQDTEFLLDTLASNPASVVMFPNGVAAATTTFTVGLDGYTRRIRLSRGGQVRIVP